MLAGVDARKKRTAVPVVRFDFYWVRFLPDPTKGTAVPFLQSFSS